MFRSNISFMVLAVLVAAPLAASGQTPLGTAFTYQGQLKLNGAPLNDRADFKLVIWDALTGGHQVGPEYQHNNADVRDGLFMIRVDLGDGVFDSDARWVQVWVRYPSITGTFVAIAPRQPLTATPYALFSRDTRGVFVADDGKIGLGTTSPKQLLHVEGDYYGRGHVWLHAYEGDGSSGTAYVQARDDSGSSSISLRLRTQSAGSQVDVMTMTPSGFAGIGTTTPQQRLDVNGIGRFNASAGPNLIINDPNGGSDRPGIEFTNNNIVYLAGDGLSDNIFGFYSRYGNARAYDATVNIYGDTQGSLGTWGRFLSLTHDGTDGIISTDTGHLLLEPAGNVGIATDAPLAPLHVGSTGSKWGWTSGNGWGDLCVGNGNMGLALGVALGGGGAGDVRLWAKGGTERLFIGNPTDGAIVTIDDGRLGVPDVGDDARLDVTSLSLGAPTGDWAAHFKDTNGTGEAWLAGNDTVDRQYGIEAHGHRAGGYFKDTDGVPEARVAYTADDATYGVWARGYYGGYFESSYGDGAHASLAVVDVGVAGHGSYGGAYFTDTDDSGWARVGYGSYKVFGNGGVSFVQNHPYDPDRVIVYTAPEGDEVATYTRGTARLVHGEARVELGDTFQWVTNPDIGLTVHLTPRGDCEGLYVESLTTSELVVRELRGGNSDVVFDYLVFGLRIGFEETATVQEKTQDAGLPSMKSHLQTYEAHPDLRRFDALERYKSMRAAAGVAAPVDLTAARELVDAVGKCDMKADELAPSLGAADGARRAAVANGGATGEDASALPQPVAHAASDNEIASLAARMARLEAEMAQLRAESGESGR